MQQKIGKLSVQDSFAFVENSKVRSFNRGRRHCKNILKSKVQSWIELDRGRRFEVSGKNLLKREDHLITLEIENLAQFDEFRNLK